MKCLVVFLVACLFAFSVMAVESKTVAAPEAGLKIEKEVKAEAPIVPACEAKKALKKCKKAKDVKKVEKKLKCTCPAK